MRITLRAIIIAISSIFFLLLCVMLSRPALRAGVARENINCGHLEAAYMRTNLYFGMAHNNGSVTDSEWQAFVREEVTPRFPDGLTFWTASGQWRRPNGSIGVEQARVLLVVHSRTSQAQTAIRAIAERYKSMFKQDSVMSETAAVCAQF
jgi:hypothetical protein